MEEFGGPDLDLESTEERLEYIIGSENDTTVLYGIFLKNPDGCEGDLIGEVAVDIGERFWPSIFFILKEEHWGKGYGTESVKVFVEDFWWTLPRMSALIQVDPWSLDADSLDTHRATELLCAGTKDNRRSEGVLRNAGFELKGEFNGYLRWRFPRK
jgi:RimJ/RimL family protein N-acetyltransferase